MSIEKKSYLSFLANVDGDEFSLLASLYNSMSHDIYKFASIASVFRVNHNVESTYSGTVLDLLHTMTCLLQKKKTHMVPSIDCRSPLL